MKNTNSNRSPEQLAADRWVAQYRVYYVQARYCGLDRIDARAYAEARMKVVHG